MKLGVFIIALICSGVAHAEPEGLRELIHHAQDNQLQWQTALTGVKKAEEGVIIQRSKFLPDLGLQSKFSYDWQEAQKNGQQQESVGSEASIVSNWLLYDNGTGFRNYRIRLLELDRARSDEQAIREQVSYDILSRYVNHMFARRQRDITTQKLSMLQQQYKVTERMYRQGLKTRRDYQRLYAEVERAKLNLARQEDELRNTFEELLRYVGRTDIIKAPEQLRLIKSENLLETLQRRTTNFKYNEQNVPQVHSAELNIEIQKLRTREAQATLWPEINLSTSAGYGSSQFIRDEEHWADQERIFTGAQLQLSWKLFEWGGRDSTYRSAVLDQQLSDMTYQQERLNAKIAYTKQQRQADRQNSSLKVVRDIFEIEKKTYIDIEEEYRSGKATYLDLITSLDRQTQAEIDLEQEINNYLLVLAETLKQSGGLYDAVSKF